MYQIVLEGVLHAKSKPNAQPPGAYASEFLPSGDKCHYKFGQAVL